MTIYICTLDSEFFGLHTPMPGRIVDCSSFSLQLKMFGLYACVTVLSCSLPVNDCIILCPSHYLLLGHTPLILCTVIYPDPLAHSLQDASILLTIAWPSPLEVNLASEMAKHDLLFSHLPTVCSVLSVHLLQTRKNVRQKGKGLERTSMTPEATLHQRG